MFSFCFFRSIYFVFHTISPLHVLNLRSHICEITVLSPRIFLPLLHGILECPEETGKMRIRFDGFLIIPDEFEKIIDVSRRDLIVILQILPHFLHALVGHESGVPLIRVGNPVFLGIFSFFSRLSPEITIRLASLLCSRVGFTLFLCHLWCIGVVPAFAPCQSLFLLFQGVIGIRFTPKCRRAARKNFPLAWAQASSAAPRMYPFGPLFPPTLSPGPVIAQGRITAMLVPLFQSTKSGFLFCFLFLLFPFLL